MLDLATLTAEIFSPELNEIFRLVEGDKSYELRLVEVRPLGTRRSGQPRDPFALIFRGQPGLRAQQRIYRLENARLGEMEIFLVQLSDGPDGSTFEAIFN